MVTPGQSWEWETARTGLFPGPCVCACVCVCVCVCVCDSCASLKAGSPKVKGKLGLTCSTHWGVGNARAGFGSLWSSSLAPHHTDHFSEPSP